MRVACVYQQLGYNVLFPFGDMQRYDLVVEKDGKFQRIQVKTVTAKDDYLYVDVRVIGHNRKKINVYKPKKHDFDVLAIVESKSQAVYAIPFDGAQLQYTLRINATKNRQLKRIRMASDHALLA